MTATYYNNFVDTTNFSDTSFRFTLTAGFEQSITVPGSSTDNLQALFGIAETDHIFVGYNFGASIPADNTHESVGQTEMNPEKRFVKGGDVLYFLSPDTKAWLTVSFRKLP